ncbi:winged helix-turn-helix domain-containing protein [Streptomyces sp. HNM0574]|uniref:ArsR/SmtB family transcription factor n=1 Tax=Streptomyces sp. HNM0574 TaxID=2714954 RepID=UPI00146C9BC3|nr:winged helix-turn-helix domain-containing protein [Streptomyces sp. HNM0574]NLU65926.1 winged helix-turn-helix transcriptional regulator [Streptomyces sp. HNM0574]
MLRLHFTAVDIARTHVADGPDPLWETLLSLQELQEREPDPTLATWRGQVLRSARTPLRALLPLAPVRGYSPDFLTPPEGSNGLEAGLDALLSTPRTELRAQIGRLAENGPLSPWTRSLAEGSATALRALEAALRDYRRTALGPSWPRVRARTEADRAWRARTQWYGGTEAMLRTFTPLMRWDGSVLEADYPVDRDVELAGRGLLLVPSYFCRRTPVALADPALPPTLVYPAERVPATAPPGGPHPAALPGTTVDAGGPHLARLLGHTRAAVLQSLGGECTTSELALRAGVSVSSASEHAAVLRAAGLITSTRHRNAVRHTLTPLGLALLGPAHGTARPGAAGRGLRLPA